jgi:hypothetical protein
MGDAEPLAAQNWPVCSTAMFTKGLRLAAGTVGLAMARMQPPGISQEYLPLFISA